VRPDFTSKKYGCVVSTNGRIERMHLLKSYVQMAHTDMQSSDKDWRGICRPQYVVSICYDLLS